MDTPRKSRKWIWYFAVLGVLTVIATSTLAVYNIKQQLKPEQLAAAIDLWDAQGPKNYVLEYTARKTVESVDMSDAYIVKVKDGVAYEVLDNGQPLEPRQLAYYGMHRLLQDVERFMEMDMKPGAPSTYRRGDFDGKTGALVRYVRRVMGTRQRLEINVHSLRPM
jgi:hypothetical protein